MLIKVAKAFDVTTDWLMEDDSLTIKERPQANTVTIIGRVQTTAYSVPKPLIKKTLVTVYHL